MIQYSTRSPKYPLNPPFRTSLQRKLLLALFIVSIFAQFFFLQKYILPAQSDDQDEVQVSTQAAVKNNYLENLSKQNQIYTKRSLSFETSEGFALHRMGLINAVIFSILQKRTLILTTKSFCLDGKDCDDANLFYDWKIFLEVLQQNKIAFQFRDVDKKEQGFRFQCKLPFQQSCYDDFSQQDSNSNIQVVYPESIPIPYEIATKQKGLIKKLFEGLQLSEYYKEIKEKVVTRIQFISGSQNFSALYFNKTESESNVIPFLKGNKLAYSKYAGHISAQLQMKEFEEDIPLFIWSNNIDIWSSEPINQLFSELQKQGREYILENPIYSDIELEQQFLTAINYYISLEVHRMMGDGSHITIQLLVLERQLRGKWVSYFNQEQLQMFTMYPILDVPWIFTHNDWSSKVDYLVKVAVRSAIQVGGVTPYCLFSGNRDSKIGQWLQDMGVKLISHEPKWMPDLVMKNSRAKEYKDSHSHLYGTPEGIIGTFLRIDIPILSELTQYPYVLFTDTDVYFRKRFTFEDLPKPLPQSIGMGWEMQPQFPYNAGISIMNMFNLRLNYQNFLQFILSNQEALFFPGYGPGDQGALNQYYEKTVKNWFLPEIYNTKPYKKFDKDSIIVHFHGPKPKDYYEYATEGHCRPILDGLCRMADESGMCDYAREWAQFSLEDDIGTKLVAACKNSLQFMQQTYHTIVYLEN